MSLTAKNLSERMALRTGLTRSQCQSAVEAMIGILEQTLAMGDKVNLVGFGRFTLIERPFDSKISTAIRFTPCPMLLKTLDSLNKAMD